jgi:hypothetical protein
METKALTLHGNQVPAPSNLDDLQRLAKMMAASGFFKSTEDVAKAGVKILAGQELGIGPVASCTHIYFINGKLAYEAQILASALMRRGYSYRVRTHTEKECSIEFFNETKESLGFSTFTIEDAKKAGLGGKDVWQKYPRNMLFGRAMTNGCRWFCGDIFGGAVYSPEELNAKVDQYGAVIEAEEKEIPKVTFGVGISEESKSLTDLFKPTLAEDSLPEFTKEEKQEAMI